MESIIPLSKREILLLQLVDRAPQVDQINDIALPEPQRVLQSQYKTDQAEDYRPEVGHRRLSVCTNHLQLFEGLLASIDRTLAEGLFDPEQTVVLSCPLRPAQGAGLDLISTDANSEIGNCGVFRFP